jgi:hypothetical protein
MSKYTKQEKEFGKELSNYQGKWVAIKRTGTSETIVASGKLATDARKAVERSGEKDVFYMKVPEPNRF